MADISLVLPQEVKIYFQDVFEKHSYDIAVIRFQQIMNNNEIGLYRFNRSQSVIRITPQPSRKAPTPRCCDASGSSQYL